MRFLIVLIAFTSLVAKAVADDVTLRVATLNINWGNGNLQSIEKAIIESNATIVCIQESNTISERFLRARLGRHFAYMKFAGHRGQYAAERFGFLSTLPLRNLRFEPPKHGLFGTYHAEIQVAGRRFML